MSASELIAKPSIEAIVTTRNRPDLLKEALDALLQSEHKFARITVADDSTDDVSRDLVARSFPGVRWCRGPREGIAMNRNAAMRAATADLVLVCDDDLIASPKLADIAIARAAATPSGVYFPAIVEHGRHLGLNRLSFLGFLSTPYAPGERLQSFHSMCSVFSRPVIMRELYDENLQRYGNEEKDLGYRLASAGYPLVYMPEVTCEHRSSTDTTSGPRVGPDANRLYATFKRHFWVDRKLSRALGFAILAPVHHVVSYTKRHGGSGFVCATKNVGMALGMIRSFRSNSVQSRSPHTQVAGAGGSFDQRAASTIQPHRLTHRLRSGESTVRLGR